MYAALLTVDGLCGICVGLQARLNCWFGNCGLSLETAKCELVSRNFQVVFMLTICSSHRGRLVLVICIKCPVPPLMGTYSTRLVAQASLISCDAGTSYNCVNIISWRCLWCNRCWFLCNAYKIEYLIQYMEYCLVNTGGTLWIGFAGKAQSLYSAYLKSVSDKNNNIILHSRSISLAHKNTLQTLLYTIG